MHPAIEGLATATIMLLKAKAEDLNLTPRMIGSIQPYCAVEPADLPVLDLLPGILSDTAPETADLAQAIVNAAPHLAWRQTYSEADGFDRRYLDSYGWFDLAGPDGPYRADGFRVMMGYWGQGLIYPNHSHPPEEHYLVLAGGAKFRLNDDPYRRLGPGEIFHTPAGAIHSADMRDEPLMAMSIWRAEDVTVRINLTESDREVVKR